MLETDQVQFSQRESVGDILLNRPNALNALTIDMIEALHRQLALWADDPKITGVVFNGAGDRAFCAGGDVRALYEAKQAGDAKFLENFYRREYQLNYRIATYPKPTVAIMNGIVMGGGAGIAMHCRHRIATDNSHFAMPECKIGLFPDVGAGYFLNQCPGEIGMFLALTGVGLRAPGMKFAGLATAFIPDDRVDFITPDLIERLSMPFAVAPLESMRKIIDQVFGMASIEEVFNILPVRGGNWAGETLAMMKDYSPTSLKMTFEHMRRSRGQKLDAVLKSEFRLSQHCMAGKEFFEGVRAMIVDKDKTPAWRPMDLKEVSGAGIKAMFEPMPGIADWTADK